MMISGIDLENHLSSGKIDTYEVGSINVLNMLYNKKWEVLLPDCDESHAMIGNWLIDGSDIRPRLITPSTPLIIPRSKLGEVPVYFVEIPGWEMLVEQNPFLHHISIYFRQLRKH